MSAQRGLTFVELVPIWWQKGKSCMKNLRSTLKYLGMWPWRIKRSETESMSHCLSCSTGLREIAFAWLYRSQSSFCKNKWINTLIAMPYPQHCLLRTLRQVWHLRRSNLRSEKRIKKLSRSIFWTLIAQGPDSAWLLPLFLAENGSTWLSCLMTHQLHMFTYRP